MGRSRKLDRPTTPAVGLGFYLMPRYGHIIIELDERWAQLRKIRWRTEADVAVPAYFDLLSRSEGRGRWHAAPTGYRYVKTRVTHPWFLSLVSTRS